MFDPEKSSDAELQVQFQCFGQMWDPYENMCAMQCAVQARCLHRLATTSIDEVVSAFGADIEEMGASMLAEQLHGMTPQVAKYVLEYRAKPAIGLPAIQPDGTLAGTFEGNDVPFGVDDEPAEEEESAPENDVDLEEANSALQKAVEEYNENPIGDPMDVTKSLNDTVAEIVEAAAPDIVHVTITKKKTKKKVAKKPKTLGEHKAAKKATKKKTVAKKTTTNGAKPKQPGTGTKPWSAATYARRFERERQKPEIAKLPVGYAIEKEHEGKTHEVQLEDNGWRYGGELYPTLYAVMMGIRGHTVYPGQMKDDGTRRSDRAMSSMSALRFFGLERKRGGEST